jgi:hypothetical protein
MQKNGSKHGDRTIPGNECKEGKRHCRSLSSVAKGAVILTHAELRRSKQSDSPRDGTYGKLIYEGESLQAILEFR